ncbi:cadherin repeat domain-containing protein [Sungkyunkwania multivorans]|uniref:Cadherin repeat domain-containing protein n=1 Tax=Sungkyunkwania multivorans TaxID=1173618 RepID=A0ABW3CY09_9FLAO
MKKTLKFTNLFMLALSLIIFSCSDDDSVEITLEDLTVTIDENPISGQIIGTIEVMGTSSPDFSISSQTPNGALAIDNSSGELTVADAALFDFETNPVITATVSAVGAANSATVTINLTNVEVTVQDLTVTIDENPTTGQVLGLVQSSGGVDSNFSVVSQTPFGALSIDMTTGELTVADAALFDFETNPIITASISDSESANPATVTINLTNINEVVFQTFDESIDENPTNGQVIGTVQSNATGNPNYSIVSQTPAGAIAIDPNTGVVTVADASLFDYEINQGVDAVISADDADDSSDFEIQIDNVNEIGDFNHGGIIFWIDPTSNNSEGLVISLYNQAGGVPWGCLGVTTGATGTAIGTGETNTNAIMNSTCASGSAAEIAYNLNENGFDDWFLPSMDEWNEFYSNLSILGNAILANGGDVISNSYWSSTEVDSNNAIWYNVTQSVSLPKDNTILGVRAVRAWTDF